MKPRSTDEIRQAYLDFFDANDHAVIPGSPLIPENDPTVLFTTAGMHPLVPYLLGEAHPKGKCLTSCQKCIRTQDIDEVGDESHLTFFEMLGNWSFGDYFKEGAIRLSFQFLTEVLEIPIERLAVTCFCGDDDAPKDEESANWWEEVGIDKGRIGFLPKKDNWWGPAGQTGPCGPDTEMFVWVYEGEPQGNPETHPDGWLEIWNDVFMQYEKTLDGKFKPLKQQNVDTGMGLERTAQVLQRVENVYETDLMKPIMQRVLSLQDVRHETLDVSTTPTQTKVSSLKSNVLHSRIIVDHLKAAVFIISDGITPSNVDQGYVLRKLIRRAIRSSRQFEVEHSPFSPLIAKTIIKQYGHIYGSLKKNEKNICDTLAHEEEQFEKCLTAGMKQFEKIVNDLSGTKLDGNTVFHLYDTYGFPLELTKEIAAERNMTVDEKGFNQAFLQHQHRSRVGAEQKFAGGLADHSTETTKLHTATHLLHTALKTVLGDNIEQKGSNITQERLRFDFNHPEKMSRDQIARVEHIVNDAISADLHVSYRITTVEGAKEQGAIGVFGERYGEEVKVYTIGDDGKPFSLEICGGPHVAQTSLLGSFKIIKEESSSAGVRRIKAVVSGGPKEIEMAKEEK